MKQIGIVVDNYKLSKFKGELSELGYKDVTTLSYTKQTLIKIEVKEIDFDEHTKKIAAMCFKLEAFFKNNKQKS